MGSDWLHIFVFVYAYGAGAVLPATAWETEEQCLDKAVETDAIVASAGMRDPRGREFVSYQQWCLEIYNVPGPHAENDDAEQDPAT